jgi:hypothetical protein
MNLELSRECLESVSDCLIEAFYSSGYPLKDFMKKMVYKTLVTDTPVYQEWIVKSLIFNIVNTDFAAAIKHNFKDNQVVKSDRVLDHVAMDIYCHYINNLNVSMNYTSGGFYAKDFSFSGLLVSECMFQQLSTESSEPSFSGTSSAGRQDDWGELAWLDDKRISNRKQ